MMHFLDGFGSGARIALVLVLQFGFSQRVFAQDHALPAGDGQKGSDSMVEARLRSELRVVLMDLVQSGAFGHEPVDRISLTLDSPAERTFDLGVFVDSSSGASARKGLLVLGTTPGSLAGRLGFRSGDTVVAVNGISLVDLGNDPGGSARAARVFRETLASLADGASLKFRIARKDEMIELEGNLSTIEIPALHLRLGESQPGSAAELGTDSKSGDSRGCGRVSVFDNAPRQQQLHGVTLISIDGERSPLAGQVSIRLSAGRHELKVGERIDSRYLGFGERFRDRSGQDRYKTIVVDVSANTTYFLAARLNADHANEWRDGAYWDPVVWSKSREACH
jgi:hypothetical protein